MKKFISTLLFLSMISATAVAQDDMYFKPTKKEKKAVTVYQPKVTDYSCNRDIDEYNRRGKFRSQYSVINSDSTANDIIDFETGVPSDTIYYGDVSDFTDDDYAYSRRLSRFDDYYWYEPWYSWYGPWGYTSPYWYAHYGWGWYDPWYDPWYYGGWGWHYPYYAGWYGGWHHPIYIGNVGGGRPGNGWRYTGTHNRVRTYGTSNGSFAQRNGVSRSSSSRNISRRGISHDTNNSFNNTYRNNSINHSNYGGSSFGSGSRSSFGGGGNSSFGGGSRSFGGGARGGGRIGGGRR